MELARYMPRRPLLATRPDTITRLFDEFFTPFVNLDRQMPAGGGLNLQVDIYEKDNRIVVDAELPGIDKKDITVDVKGKLLTLGGERRDDEEIKEENRYRRERRYGRFERTFSMPFEIDPESVTARYENGILRLEIPKPEEQQQKQITIQ
jgi:HSP20 family protein